MLALLLGVLNIYETFYYMSEGTTRFGNSLGIIWTLWGVYAVSVIVFFWRRRSLQRKYTAKARELNEEPAKMNIPYTYFFQLPIAQMVDGMPIHIHGKRCCTFEYQFYERIHKILTLMGFVNLMGINLKSEERVVKIRPIKPFQLQNLYEVYVDGHYYGCLQSKRLLKEKGIKKFLHFSFDSPHATLSIENDHLHPELTMTTEEHEQLFIAKRNVLTLEKSVYSGKRGEQHAIRIREQAIYDEVLLAIYVVLMQLRNE